MELKQSKYNIEIDTIEDEKILIFNSYSQAFGIMDKKCKELYDKIEKLDVSKLTNNNDIKNVKIMKDNKFIINKDIDELELIKLHEKIAKFRNSEVLSLTIAPTLNCNMDCPYCYESKTTERMSDEGMRDLINFINKNLENKKYLNITWYGGEPLLEKQRIYDISKEVIKMCNDKDIKFSANIVTNGILLDYNTAKNLKEQCNVYNAQITLDGYGDENNKRRLLKNGGDSFKIIIDNIDKAKDFLQIDIRMNTDKTNINSILTLIDFFSKEKKWTTQDNIFPYIAPVYNLNDRNNADNHICYAPNEFLSINSLVTDKFINNNLISKIKVKLPPRRTVSCSAICLDNAYVIDPSGLLYACWDMIGMKNHNIGNIKEGPKMNPEKMRWLKLEIPTECYECKLLPLCSGGCPSLRLINSNSKSCSHKILNYKDTLKMIYENYKKNKLLIK
ncbi:hypothetical protein Z968_08045 [Clostridium novyi A str. 4552]|uniref:Radical SAM core domain-containing protein n=1 Tax=Clostridium novyi A str. 4552 TaxID=1444289 RepID=A0A0A0I5G9_CLONO|nr:radical SAM protein [Clostridium novyi]KGM95838.1 hypothetical protein Z968_08045 [Clostridium novyi A str. 4552]